MLLGKLSSTVGAHKSFSDNLFVSVESSCQRTLLSPLSWPIITSQVTRRRLGRRAFVVAQLVPPDIA